VSTITPSTTMAGGSPGTRTLNLRIKSPSHGGCRRFSSPCEMVHRRRSAPLFGLPKLVFALHRLRRARVEIASRARGGCKCRVGVKFATSCADHRHFTDQATRLPDFIQRYGSGGRRSCWHRRPAGPEGLDDLGPRVWGGARTKTALRLQRFAPKSGEDMEVRLFESRYFPPRLGAVRHVGWWMEF